MHSKWHPLCGVFGTLEPSRLDSSDHQAFSRRFGDGGRDARAGAEEAEIAAGDTDDGGKRALIGDASRGQGATDLRDGAI